MEADYPKMVVRAFAEAGDPYGSTLSIVTATVVAGARRPTSPPAPLTSPFKSARFLDPGRGGGWWRRKNLLENERPLRRA